MTDTEKPKIKFNKLTLSAGLSLNINAIKKDMGTYCVNEGLYVDSVSKDDDGNQIVKQKKPMFSGGHIAMTAAVQELCRYICSAAFKYTEADEMGFKRVSRGTLRLAIIQDESLREFYHTERLRAFDKDQSYLKQFPVNLKELTEFLKKVDINLVLTNKARNFLCYLVVKAYYVTLRTAYRFLVYAKRTTMTADTILSAIDQNFEGALLDRLTTAIDNAIELADPNKEKEDNADAKAAAEDGDADVDADYDDDDDYDVDNDEYSDEEEIAVPVKKATKEPKKEPKKATKKEPKKATKKESKKVIEPESEEDYDYEDDYYSDVEPVVTKPSRKSGGKKKR